MHQKNSSLRTDILWLVFVLLCLNECALWWKTRADHKCLAIFKFQAKMIVPWSVHHSFETWQSSHVYTTPCLKWIQVLPLGVLLPAATHQGHPPIHLHGHATLPGLQETHLALYCTFLQLLHCSCFLGSLTLTSLSVLIWMRVGKASTQRSG